MPDITAKINVNTSQGLSKVSVSLPSASLEKIVLYN